MRFFGRKDQHRVGMQQVAGSPAETDHYSSAGAVRGLASGPSSNEDGSSIEDLVPKCDTLVRLTSGFMLVRLL